MAADPAYEAAPIYYSKTKAVTALTIVRDRIANGEDLLSGASDQEVLSKLLKLLEIPVESQVLVFSKTSDQNSKISPQTPRAIYYSDNAYVGWVQRGNIEVISFDRSLGMVFHVLEIASGQENREIDFVRTSSCLSCHAGTQTDHWPGITVRSVYTTKSGLPIYRAGTFRTDHSSSIAERWGGWYVTGHIDGPSHMGNAFAETSIATGQISLRPLAKESITDLQTLFPAESYIGGASSDIVALLILEHQLVVHNALVQGNLVTQQVLYRHQSVSKTFSEPVKSPLSGANFRLIEHQVEQIVAALLYKNEHPLGATAVQGAIAFQQAFGRNAIMSKEQRSLKDLRLYERLLQYRCSYLIYSDAFKHLPEMIRLKVLQRIASILDGDDARYAYLSPLERTEISAILRQTLPEFANLEPL